MAEMLSLRPEDERSLHPEALKWFNARRAEIQFEVPLEELCDDELNTLLSDDEKSEFVRCMREITKRLATCLDIGDGACPDPLAVAIISLTVFKFEVNPLTAFNNIKLLLKKAYHRKMEAEKKRKEEEKRKAEEAEAERKRKEQQAEEEKRWRAARKAVNPPIDDAKRYLDKPSEYEEFIEAAREAIEVCREKGQDYLNASRTFDYRWFLKKINDRKEQIRRQIITKLEVQQRKATTESEAQEYNHRLNKEIARLKSLLYYNKKDLQGYFHKEIGDHRYTGQSFAQFLSSEEEKDFDKTIIDIGIRKLDEIVFNDFHQFIHSKC